MSDFEKRANRFFASLFASLGVGWAAWGLLTYFGVLPRDESSLWLVCGLSAAVVALFLASWRD